MKKISLIVFTTITLLFSGIGNSNAQENSSEMVIIRIDEMRRGAGSAIITTDPEGNSSIIELEKGFDETGSNAKLIQKELVKWKQKGYKITHLSTSAASYGDFPQFRTTIILEN